MTPALDSLLDALLELDDEVERLEDRRPDASDPDQTPAERAEILEWIRGAEADVRAAEARFVGLLASVPEVDLPLLLKDIPARFRTRLAGLVKATVSPEGAVQ